MTEEKPTKEQIGEIVEKARGLAENEAPHMEDMGKYLHAFNKYLVQEGYKAGRENLRLKINEKLYELRGMEGEFRDGQRSVFEWMLRELRGD